MIDVDLAKRIADLVDGDAWQLADLLVEAFPADAWGDTDRAGGKTGLRDELRRYELAINREYGVTITGSTLRIYRATALAWPRDTRVSLAPFGVHLRMRGQDRRAEMPKRLRQAKAEKRALSIRMLTRFRAEENPTPGVPYEQRLQRAITNAIRREMLAGIITKRPDWWMADSVVQRSRDVAVGELRRLADAIEAGEIRAEV